MSQKIGFDMWCRKVDQIIMSRFGLGKDDLEDQPWRDWYEEGISAKQAVARALKNCGY